MVSRSQMSQAPPVPSYIFRGHASPIHALHFLPDNAHLVSGDSDGWVVVWSLGSKRPIAVWKGHEGGIMGLEDWQHHKLISHGRDHKLRVWQLRLEDYEGLDVKLPVDGADAVKARQPWLLHSLSVNALNYCAFSICNNNDMDTATVIEHTSSSSTTSQPSLLLAAPNGLDAGGIDIFHLPSEHRVCKLPSDKETQTGMVMALSIFHHPRTGSLVLTSGYETGHVMMHVRKDAPERGEWKWMKVMTSQPHSQPVLSLNSDANAQYCFSSAADAAIARFNVESAGLDKKVDTKHAGQQDLKVRDDGKIIATAGWDHRVRVYSVKTLKELAVLKWHQEGCYATAFANTVAKRGQPSTGSTENALIKTAVEMLRNEQTFKAQNIHWLAAGGKDGKISLWDIY